MIAKLIYVLVRMTSKLLPQIFSQLLSKPQKFSHNDILATVAICTVSIKGIVSTSFLIC